MRIKIFHGVLNVSAISHRLGPQLPDQGDVALKVVSEMLLGYSELVNDVVNPIQAQER